MAKILGIHGIGQQFSGGRKLGSVWYDALWDGLVAAHHRPTADKLARTDLEVAFFGDLFRRPGTMRVRGPQYSVDDIQPGLELDLLTEFYEAAVAEDPLLGTPQGAMRGRKRRPAAQVMLNRLANSPTFVRIAEPFFAGNLKQVTAFLTDATVKKNVLARVRERMRDDTQVLIGHSLGSVVAYEYLCHERPASVKLLVTLGSPLGIPNLIFDKLTPAPVGGAGEWPGTVARWVNVADLKDKVALRKDLAPLFPGPGRTVTDREADNGEDPHAVDRYLNSRQTGSALGDVLG